jgi:hypothetical protein
MVAASVRINAAVEILRAIETTAFATPSRGDAEYAEGEPRKNPGFSLRGSASLRLYVERP